MKQSPYPLKPFGGFRSIYRLDIVTGAGIHGGAGQGKQQSVLYVTLIIGKLKKLPEEEDLNIRG